MSCSRGTLVRTALVLGLAAPLGAVVERAPLGMMGWSSPQAVPFHGAEHGFPVPPGFPAEAPGKRLAASQAPTYSYADLAAMSHPALVATLRAITFRQITDLFVYSEAAREFYDDDARMNALFEALREDGQTFTPDDGRGIATLVEVIRAGFYLALFHPELARLNTWGYHLLCLPALDSITRNPSFGWGTPTQVEVLQSWASS